MFGPKTDRWLEYTVCGLLITNGCAQVRAVDKHPDAARAIGIGTATTLLAIDAVFVPKGTIRWTCLLDGAAEAGWLLLWRRVGAVKQAP